MSTLRHARLHAEALAAAATHGTPDAWAAQAQQLSGLDGRDWLLLDQAARVWRAERGPAVSGTVGWLGASAAEPTGLVAAVTSLHADGRIRQRATRILAGTPGPLAAAALAVRLLDRAPQVRGEAEQGVLRRQDPLEVAAMLDVLLAGRARRRAPEALRLVRSVVLDVDAATGLAAALQHAERPRARRWALALAQERGRLTADRLLAEIPSERDQWVRRAFAEWLVELADPVGLRPLLAVPAVDARLVALTHLPDDALPDDELLELLMDPAPRVRDLARRRATTRGIELAGRYRAGLAAPGSPPRHVAACVEGLTAVGDARDLELFVTGLRHDSARVRVAAVAGVVGRAPWAEAVQSLAPLLLDPSPQVAVAAARGLVRVGAPREVTDAAWASAQPWSRRAAWRLGRERGSWGRVEADLRAATDTDPVLADAGVAGIRTWLRHGAATTWAVLPDEQRERIADLLEHAPLAPAVRREVAFHAGVGTADENRSAVRTDAPNAGRARRWLRAVRGGRSS